MAHEVKFFEVQRRDDLQHIIGHRRYAAIHRHLAAGPASSAMVIGDDPEMIGKSLDLRRPIGARSTQPR
ncbi:hypothetical protein D3C78_1920550 [compost metagenome]